MASSVPDGVRISYHRLMGGLIRPGVAVLGLWLTGCATPYQPSGFAGGFEDTQVGPGRFFIKVNGNGYTGETTLVSYFHRRAAELCRGAGFAQYAFETQTSSTQHQTASTYTATTTQSLGATQTRIQEHPGMSFTKYGVSGYVACADPIPPVATAHSVTPAAPTVVQSAAAPQPHPAAQPAALAAQAAADRFDMAFVDEGCTVLGAALADGKPPASFPGTASVTGCSRVHDQVTCTLATQGNLQDSRRASFVVKVESGASLALQGVDGLNYIFVDRTARRYAWTQVLYQFDKAAAVTKMCTGRFLTGTELDALPPAR